MNKEKRVIKVILPIILGLVLIMGVSYAWFNLVINGTKNNVLKAGNLELVLDETGSSISLDKAVPITEQEGLKTTPYQFELKNNGGNHSEYHIYLDDEAIDSKEKRIDDKYIRFNLTKNGATIKTDLLSTIKQDGVRILDEGIILAGKTNNYELRMWVDSEAGIEAMDKVFKGKLRVEGSQVIAGTGEVNPGCFTFNSTTGTITGYSNSCPKDVKIPEQIAGVTVKSIGPSAFRNKMLTSVSIPKTVTNIGMYAFLNNQLPDDQAFIYNRNSDGTDNKTSLNSYGGAKRENVVIPEGIKTIGIASFDGLSIKSITLSESVTKIEERAFMNNQLTHIEIPSSVISLGPGVFTNNQLSDDQAFIYNRNSDGSIDNTILNSYGGAKRENVEIPSQVKVLGNRSFCKVQMNSLSIPMGVERIEDTAFDSALLRHIEIPSSVTYIAPGSFRNNQLPDEEAFIYARKNDGSIDYTTLVSYGGTKKDIIIPEGVKVLSGLNYGGITSVILPNTLTNMTSLSLLRNNFTTITIPPNVTNISTKALAENANLKKIINQTGRSFDWKAITDGNGEATFVTGTIPHPNGNIEVVSE